jgi:hypothetical protein
MWYHGHMKQIMLIFFMSLLGCGAEDKPTVPIPHPPDTDCPAERPSLCYLDKEDPRLCHKDCDNYCECSKDMWLCTTLACVTGDAAP